MFPLQVNKDQAYGFFITFWSFHCFVQVIIFKKWKSSSHNLETYWEIGVETMDIKFAEIYVNKKITRLKLTRILEVHINFMKH